MNEETIKFLAKICLREASAKDYSDWAISCLEEGIDSKNIRILASMFDARSMSEAETYFKRCLDDLNWHYPIAEICLPEYAKLIAAQILNKEIDALAGCNEIYKVYRGLDYEPELANWDYLIAGIDPQTDEDLIIEKNGVRDTQLLEEAIRKEAAKLIYGKETTVHQYTKKPDFEFAEIKPEGFLTKIWKKIF